MYIRRYVNTNSQLNVHYSLTDIEQASGFPRVEGFPPNIWGQSHGQDWLTEHIRKAVDYVRHNALLMVKGESVRFRMINSSPAKRNTNTWPWADFFKIPATVFSARSPSL